MSSLVKNTFIYTVGRIIPQLSGFILLPLFTSHMSPQEYGIVQSIQILSALLTIFFSLATERSVFRLYHDYETESDKKKLVGNITLLITSASTILVILLFLFSNIVHKIYSSIEFHPYFTYGILTAYLSIFIILPNNLFQTKGKAFSFTALSIANFIISSALMIYFVIFREENAIGMLKGQLIANAIMLLVYLPIIFKQSTFKFDKKILKNTLSFSLPMIPSLLSGWILTRSNSIFIEQFINLHDVGIYGTAFKISSIASLLLGAFFIAYVPVFYKYANAENIEDSKKTLEKLNYVYSLMTIIVCFSISFVSRELIGIFLPISYFESYKIVPLLNISIIISQIAALFNLMVYQNKKNISIMLVIIFSAAISIIANLLLIPRFGINGAVYGSLIGIFINFVLVVILAQKNFYIKLKFGNLAIISIIFFIAILIDNYFINASNIFLSLTIKIVIISALTIFFLNKYKSQLIALRKI